VRLLLSHLTKLLLLLLLSDHRPVFAFDQGLPQQRDLRQQQAAS